jgi:hypothetical protein
MPDMSAAPATADGGDGRRWLGAASARRRQGSAVMAALLVLCAAVLGLWAAGHCSATPAADHLTEVVAARDGAHPALPTSAAIGVLRAAADDTPVGIAVRPTTSTALLTAHDIDVKLMMELGLLTALLGAARFSTGRGPAHCPAQHVVRAPHPDPLVTAPRLSVLCIART